MVEDAPTWEMSRRWPAPLNLSLPGPCSGDVDLAQLTVGSISCRAGPPQRSNPLTSFLGAVGVAIDGQIYHCPIAVLGPLGDGAENERREPER